MAQRGHGRLARVLHVVREYSKLSSLHGMRHIVKEGASAKERLFWLALVTLGGALMSWLCLQQWLSFLRVPTETALQDSAVSIVGIPFPCISLCPTHQIDKAVAMRLLRAELSAAGTDEDVVGGAARITPADADLLDILRALHLMNGPSPVLALKFLRRQSKRMLAALDALNIVDFMKRVFPTCDTFFHSCLWRGVPFDCCKHFVTKPTEVGFCYNFDIQEADKMVCAEAFFASAHQRMSCLDMQAASLYGPGSGLRVFLGHGHDPATVVDDKLVSGSLARVSVHPDCIATTKSMAGTVYASPAGAYFLALDVTRTVADPRLLALRPERRGCYARAEWPGTTAENRANFPDKYTLLECTVQCRRRYVLDVCGCILYPLTLGDPITVCSVSKMAACIANASAWINFIRPPASAPGFSADEYVNGPICDHCLPNCESLVYRLTARVPNVVNLTERRFADLEHLTARTMVDIHFAGPNAATVFSLMPTVTVGTLLVTFGAMANLFLGMSYLTVLEFFIVSIKCIWIVCVEPYVYRRS